MKKFSHKTWLTMALFAVAAVIVCIFMPRADKDSLNYELNRPWGNAQLLAPFNIPIYRDAESKQRLVDSVRENFVPIFAVDQSPLEKLLDMVNKSSELSASDRQTATTALRAIYENGVVEQETADRISSGELTDIKVHTGGGNRTVSTAKMRSPRRAYMRLDTLVGSRHPELMKRLGEMGVASHLTPNYIEDEQQSTALLNEMLQPFEAGIGVIQQGERIIDRGDIVTPQLYQILQTYEAELAKRSGNDGTVTFNITLGQLLFALLAFALFYVYLDLYRPAVAGSLPKVICLLSLLTVFFVFSVIMASSFSSGLYIVPYAILPIVIVVFFDTSVAMFALLLEILICAPFATFPLEFVFIETLAGMTAIFSTKELSKRSQLLRTSAMVFGAYVIAYIAVELMQVGALNSVSWKLIGYFAINMVLTSFAYIMIFLIEKIFGFTSVVTLVELSDINSPLLRELSVECPGTFQHCMAVSNLVTGAAHKVGANVQLVRAGALYHDIGKTKNPAFFTENQHGVNPHDALSPEQSARIIINHVTDGARLADREKLPKVIRDMILQHHGKGTARYFYTIYCNAHPGEEVDPAPFTYPGPNPQSKEASLLMMADVVEAASRSLPDHKPDTISAMVNKLIDQQVAAGMHNDSPLSFRDITEIKKAFIDALRTMYHVRVAYPEARK